MQSASDGIIGELNERSRTIFREIVEAYVQTGEPVGSRTLSRRLPQPLSPATIRNVMADLEDMGLLLSPHTSAGRVPTVQGYRLFVDTMLTVEPPDEADVERARVELEHVDRSGGRSVVWVRPTRMTGRRGV